MSEMVERVALAVARVEGCGYTPGGQRRALCCDDEAKDHKDGYGEMLWRENCDCMKVARAAIEAMREPTEAMSWAIAGALDAWDEDQVENDVIYQRAIEAALSPHPVEGETE